KDGGGADNLAVAVPSSKGSIDATLPIRGNYRVAFSVPTVASILSQPKDTAVYDGSTANFSVGLDLPPSVTLTSVKWQKNGVDIPGATTTSISFPAVVADNNAKVKSIITTSAGTLTSSEATMSVATISNDYTQGVVKF